MIQAIEVILEDEAQWWPVETSFKHGCQDQDQDQDVSSLSSQGQCQGHDHEGAESSAATEAVAVNMTMVEVIALYGHRTLDSAPSCT
jgi:hypothetical protein